MILDDFFSSNNLINGGSHTPQHVADLLIVSPNYLANLLKSITGQTIQQNIHYKLTEKAKEKLSATELQIGEIAYQLRLEHPRCFNKLFKNKSSKHELNTGNRVIEKE